MISVFFGVMHKLYSRMKKIHTNIALLASFLPGVVKQSPYRINVRTDDDCFVA